MQQHAQPLVAVCNPYFSGDFAVLISSGLSIRTTLILNMGTSITALIGLYIGIAIGSVQGTGEWVFAVVAGVFIYVALVDLV